MNVSEYGPGINFEVFEIYLETSYSTKLHEGSQVFPYCNITKILIFFFIFQVILTTIPNSLKMGLLKFRIFNAEYDHDLSQNLSTSSFGQTLPT